MMGGGEIGFEIYPYLACKQCEFPLYNLLFEVSTPLDLFQRCYHDHLLIAGIDGVLLELLYTDISILEVALGWNLAFEFYRLLKLDCQLLSNSIWI